MKICTFNNDFLCGYRSILLGMKTFHLKHFSDLPEKIWTGMSYRGKITKIATLTSFIGRHLYNNH